MEDKHLPAPAVILLLLQMGRLRRRESKGPPRFWVDAGPDAHRAGDGMRVRFQPRLTPPAGRFRVVQTQRH